MVKRKVEGLSDLIPRFLRNIDAYIDSYDQWSAARMRLREWEPSERRANAEAEIESRKLALDEARETVVKMGRELLPLLDTSDATAVATFVDTVHREGPTGKAVAGRLVTEWKGWQDVRVRLDLALVKDSAKPRGATQARNGKRATTDELVRRLLGSRVESLEWSSRQIGLAICRSKSAVAGCKAYESLEKSRKMAKLERAAEAADREARQIGKRRRPRVYSDD